MRRVYAKREFGTDHSWREIWKIREYFELAKTLISHQCRKSGRISTRFGYVIVLVNTKAGKKELAPWPLRSSGGAASKLRFFRNFVISKFDGLVLWKGSLWRSGKTGEFLSHLGTSIGSYIKKRLSKSVHSTGSAHSDRSFGTWYWQNLGSGAL